MASIILSWLNRKRISLVLLALFSLYYLFAVYSKAPDLAFGYVLTIVPTVMGCVALLHLCDRNESAIPTAVTLAFALLLITGNAFQTVNEANSSLKTVLLNTLALVFACTALAVYVYIIKPKVLKSVKGYRMAIYAVGGAMLFLFLLLLVFAPNIGGARLWLRIGPMTIELSEIIKLLFFIYLALVYNSNMDVRQKIIYGAAALGASSLFFALLNEFGTVIILFAVYVVAFYIHIRSRYTIVMAVGFIIVLALALAVIFGTHGQFKESGGFIADKLNKIYARLTLEDTDQATRALQGMINGGMFGASLTYIVDVYSIEADFALAGTMQYFGLTILMQCIMAAGSIVLLIYHRSQDDEVNNHSRFKLSFILMTAFATQAILSLCGNIGLPVAGVGMPGLSAGGTQMLTVYTEIAFIVYGLQTDALLIKPLRPARKRDLRRDFYDED